MSKRLPIDPLYTFNPTPLSWRERRRIQRNTFAQFNRATLYPVDQMREELRRKREMIWLDIACGVVFGIIVLCLIGVVLQ